MSKLEFNRYLASHTPFLLSLLNTSIRRDSFKSLLEERYSVKHLNTMLRGVSCKFEWEFWVQVDHWEKIYKPRISLKCKCSAP